MVKKNQIIDPKNCTPPKIPKKKTHVFWGGGYCAHMSTNLGVQKPTQQKKLLLVLDPGTNVYGVYPGPQNLHNYFIKAILAVNN